MDLASLRALLTPTGQLALQEAVSLQPEEASYLAHFSNLSRSYPSELARAALEIAILRREATAKFPFSAGMYFTRAALEQSTAFPVSSYRSARFSSFPRVIDLGCSIGGDTLSLARVAPTIGVDLDPLRLLMAQANLRSLELEADFLCADLTGPLPLKLDANTALFFDPSRRIGGRRSFSVRQYQPPLDRILEWQRLSPAAGVKVSPGVKLEELDAYNAEIEFVSYEGELKEAVLWFGPLKTAWRRATILPGPHSLARPETGTGRLVQPLPLSEPMKYIYEPDAAILRAGLVEDLGRQLGAAQLDAQIAYLTADRQISTPFARVWEVDTWLPFQLKRLRAALRERQVGFVTVKKRGSPLQPQALIQDLRLKGDQERVVFLTHLRERPIAILALPYSLESGKILHNKESIT